MYCQLKLCASALLSMMLLGCGGGGGGGGGSALLSTGYFIDAPVAGLTYTNGSTTGTTGGDGSFSYTPGTAVTFKVGNVTVGSITNMPSDNKVTPYDIVGVARTDTTNANVAVIAQFLQSIATSSGGSLTIPSSVTTALSTTGATSLVSAGAAISSGALTTLVNTATGGTGTVVAANTALNAMNTYIANNNIDTSIRSNAAEGAWTGTSTATTSSGTANYQLDVLVLENGDFYTIFGVKSGNNLVVYGGDVGTASISGSSISGSMLEIVAGSPPITGTGTLSATVVKGTSMTGTASYTNAGSASFALTPLTGSYDYNTAASISAIQGNWTGFLLNNTSASLSIGSNGALTGTGAGCSFNGTATPRASGKNVFDLSITFGAAPCTLPGQTATGIALVYTTTSSTKQLIASVFNSAKTSGTMFFAQR